MPIDKRKEKLVAALEAAIERARATREAHSEAVDAKRAAGNALAKHMAEFPEGAFVVWQERRGAKHVQRKGRVLDVRLYDLGLAFTVVYSVRPINVSGKMATRSMEIPHYCKVSLAPEKNDKSVT